MVFEIAAWIYYTLVCVAWGSRLSKLFLVGDEKNPLDFFLRCFMGMLTVGVVGYYAALLFPISWPVRIALQLPAWIWFAGAAFRSEIKILWQNQFAGLRKADWLLLCAGILMLLVLSTAPRLHPDTLAYHAFSVDVFNRYGTLTGIANVKEQLGFQSLWFSVLALLDFRFQGMDHVAAPGLAMIWFFGFMVTQTASEKKFIRFFLLMFFCLISWTQIRLTASSFSPDFIAALAIFSVAFLFSVVGKSNGSAPALLAGLFAFMAVAIKLSAIAVLLFPCWLAIGFLRDRKYRAFSMVLLTGAVVLIPVLIRNVLSAGYAFYPTAFADWFSIDWKENPRNLETLQHYITAYARYTTTPFNTETAYGSTVSVWVPVWWRNLYLIDKILLCCIAGGFIRMVFFYRKFCERFSTADWCGCLFVLAGSILWFIKAPDPRFGTGFLLPLLYFQFKTTDIKLLQRNTNFITPLKYLAAFLILFYTGYRAIRFFEPGQLVLPAGVVRNPATQTDCDAYIQRILTAGGNIQSANDSCGNFIFRGKKIDQGFRPGH